MVLHVVWGVGSDAGKDLEKVGLDGFYIPISSIARIVVQRDKLEVYFPVIFHDSIEFGTPLVVECLKVYRETFEGESLHERILCSKMMFVVKKGEADVEDLIEITVVSNHGVLISTEITDREAASVIRVYLSNVSFPEMNIFG